MTRARMTSVHAETSRMDFAKKAAEHFTANVKHWSYGDIAPGELIALRWGMGGDCVLVLKLDDDAEPVIFQQIIDRPEVAP